MHGKIIALAVIVMLAASGRIFAQTEAGGDAEAGGNNIMGNGIIEIDDTGLPPNTIAVSFGIIGIEGSYERAFNKYFSALFDVSFTTLIVFNEFTASVKARWYPCGKIFFFDLGMGYSYGNAGILNSTVGLLGVVLIFPLLDPGFQKLFQPTHGFLIQPGLGWQIGLGAQKKWVLPIIMGLDFKVGPELPDIMPYLRIGLGYRF